jgi:hypothetical protein
MNPYEPPKTPVEPSSENDEASSLRPKLSSAQRELRAYAWAILGTLFAFCLFLLVFWSPTFSPFMTLIVLPILAFSSVAWIFVERFIFPKDRHGT